jgi:hypothetical protein
VKVLNDKTELTEPLITKIQKMGIEAADVQGGAADVQGVDGAAAPPDREEALAQLDARFKNVETAPHMDVLKRLIREHLEGFCGNHGSESAEA